ncbi:MAG: FMN-dependent NADH-azoreductase [Burkholderiaceae bacterium]
MPTLLQIDSSLFSANGQSSRLAAQFVAGWQRRLPHGRVVRRDLAADPLPHLSADRFQAFITPAEQRDAAQREAVAVSDTLIGELRAADVLVIGLPMYNFGLPSTLKAWFDHIARAGITFKYTENGSVGLLTGKQAYVFAARGGLYAGTPADTQTAYVRDFLRFLGITDVEFVYAEGLATGEAARDAALSAARERIGALTAETLAAA